MTLTRQARSDKSALVTCDSCGHQFTPDLIEEPTADGGARQSFACPGCSDVFLVAQITSRGLALREQLREAQRRRDPLRNELAGEITRHGDW